MLGGHAIDLEGADAQMTAMDRPGYLAPHMGYCHGRRLNLLKRQRLCPIDTIFAELRSPEGALRLRITLQIGARIWILLALNSGALVKSKLKELRCVSTLYS